MASSKRFRKLPAAVALFSCVAVWQIAAAQGPLMMARAIEMDAPFAGAGNHPSQPQGYLGISFHDVNDNDVAALKLKDGRGAEIVMVDHDGPAGKAGLRVHDVVLSANGSPVEGEDQLRRLLRDVPPGKSLSLVVCHDGVERTVVATMSTREDVDRQARQRWSVPAPEETVVPQEQVASAPRSSMFSRGFMSGRLLSLSSVYTGAMVNPMGTQLADYFGVKDGKGLLVHTVEPNSPAASAGLRAGDVITRANGSHLATEKEWTRALHDFKGKPLNLTVVRDRKEQILVMVPDSKKRSAVEQPMTEGPHALVM